MLRVAATRNAQTLIDSLTSPIVESLGVCTQTQAVDQQRKETND
jgi:hypothetical protein